MTAQATSPFANEALWICDAHATQKAFLKMALTRTLTYPTHETGSFEVQVLSSSPMRFDGGDYLLIPVAGTPVDLAVHLFGNRHCSDRVAPSRMDLNYLTSIHCIYRVPKNMTTSSMINWTICTFTKIFGTLVNKSIGHCRVFLFSRITYFVSYFTLGNCHVLNIMNLALNWWFSQRYKN